jgi:hypothetical protein
LVNRANRLTDLTEEVVEMMIRRKLQVFVSSTFEDLVSERQAAVSAILKTGHIPAGMELFTAGDQSQMTTIQRWIDESDVYMLILGGRYGSVEESSGVSYTELEYDYAAMQGKPLFAVVIKEDALEEKVRRIGSSCMETKNSEKLAAFRKKVLSNMSSFYSDEKDIKLTVHESLAELAATRKMKGWVSADEVAETKLLQQEVNTLREENATLNERLARVARPTGGASARGPKLEDIEEVLDKIEVAVPVSVAGKEGVKNTLFNLFYVFREDFATGVYNKSNMSEVDSFLYFNLGPKLHIHGLVDSERVPGVAYRRMFTTKLGLEILARLDRSIASGKVTFGAPPEESSTPKRKRPLRKTNGQKAAPSPKALSTGDTKNA